MDSKEILISELGFLDESIVAFDESPNGRVGGKSNFNEEVPDTTSDKMLITMIEGLSDDAAFAVMGAYRKIPQAVKDAVGQCYDTLRRLGGDTTIKDIKESLKGLKAVCGDDYKGIYKGVVKDAKKILPKIQTRLMMDGID